VRPAAIDRQSANFSNRQYALDILDFRHQSVDIEVDNPEPIIWVKQCPRDWDELQYYCQQAIQTQSKLALDYQSIELASSREILEQLIGIAKYLVETNESVNLDRLKVRLNISDRSIKLGLDTLTEIGFDLSLQNSNNLLTISQTHQLKPNPVDLLSLTTVREFLAAIEEEQFKRNYFLQVPVYAISATIAPLL
jgi:single-stranded-DNA-specific exonuclease